MTHTALRSYVSLSLQDEEFFSTVCIFYLREVPEGYSVARSQTVSTLNKYPRWQLFRYRPFRDVPVHSLIGILFPAIPD